MFIGFHSCRIFKQAEFSRQIFEKYSVQNFMKHRPVEAEMFHADGQT